jgi:hypothetical protein
VEKKLNFIYFGYKKVGRWASSQNVKLLMKGSPPITNKKKLETYLPIYIVV